MHRFLRAALLAACLLAAAAPLSHAGTSRMSYQGVLTDGGGNLVPDGNYNLTFTIYDAAVLGTAYWTESHVGVPVAKGGFSVVLGSTTPVDVPFDYFFPYFLGVQVGADPELTPRVELTASPSAMSLGMVGDNGGMAGFINWIPSTAGLGTGGGYMYLQGLTSNTANVLFEPDFSGEGLWSWYQGYGSSYVNWDGDAGAGEGRLTIGGSASTTFAPGLPGDLAVQMPADAVSSGEVLDEPGISQNHYPFSVDLSSTSSGSLTDILATTITTPAAGYIVVEADAQIGLFTAGVAGIQISETAAAALDFDHYFYVGATASTHFTYNPSSIRRTYFKPAGAHTFYFQGFRLTSGSGGTDYAWSPTITAQYFPTGYGTVTAIVNEAQAGSFDRATRLTAPQRATQPAGNGHQVDLRELELRVRREEARLAETRLQLQAARIAEQRGASARATAARRGNVGAVAPAPKEER